MRLRSSRPGLPVAGVLAAVVLTGHVRTAAAQVDSAGRDTRLAGRARVALDAATERLDNGSATQYTISPAAYPFVGEHLQVGLAPSYTLSAGPRTPTYRNYGVSATVNYVVGGGARWRGYAGGYASTTTFGQDAFTTSDPLGPPRSYAGSSSTNRATGVQAGVLVFLDPALAIRVGTNYRASTTVPFSRGTLTSFVALDPYLFGEANASSPTAAGLGVVDVALNAGRYDLPFARYHQWFGRGQVAPYLTRWAQVGVNAVGFRSSDFGGGGAYTARGFGRLYLPLTVRTQPYLEGFLQAGTLAGVDEGRLAGGTLGVRRMLNARVGLDAGIQRRVPARERLPYGGTYRAPGQTGLVVGLATRVGRAIGGRAPAR